MPDSTVVDTAAATADTAATTTASQTTEADAGTTAADTASTAATTIASTDATESTTAAAATWPDDWRTRAAGGDEKALKRFERYASPEDAMKALIAAQNKLSSGEMRSAKPKSDAPEAVAEWRKENGIPETPEGYDLSALPGGLTIGEQDKPIIEGFVKDMHAANAHPDVVKGAIASYYRMQQHEVQQQAQKDAEYRRQSEDELRTEWGNNYRQNINAVQSLLDAAPAGVKEKLQTARFADGTPFGNDPATLRWLANMSLEINPAATVVPNAGANASGAIADEMATLTKMMGDKKSDYWKGPNAEKNQARFRQLADAAERIKK